MVSLNPVYLNIKAEYNELNTITENEDSINSSIDKLLSFIKSKSVDSEEIKNTMKQNIKKIPDSTLILYSNNLAVEENNLTKAIDEAKEIIDKLTEDFDNGKVYESFEDLPKEIKEKTSTQKLDNFLQALEEKGVSENNDSLTEEEISDRIDDSVYELINALKGEETNDPIALAIAEQAKEELNSNSDNDSSDNDSSDNDSSDDDNFNENLDSNNANKKRKGLWKDIYEVLEHSKDNGGDFQSIKYSTGLATVIGKYFTTGTMHIAVHLGGNCIAGVGTSILNVSLQNLPKGFKTIQDGTKSTDLVSQCNGIRDGFSEMITNGIINTTVVGMMNAAPSPVPFVGVGKADNNQHPSVKILIFVAAMASAILTSSAAFIAAKVGATVTSASAKAFDKLIDSTEEEINKIISEIKKSQYKIFDLDEIINNTTLTLKQKIDKITSILIEERIDLALNKAKNSINLSTTKITNVLSKKVTSLKQNSLLTRFGKGSLDKIDDIEYKLKNEIPKKVEELVEDSIKKSKEIIAQKGKELTEKEMEEILNQSVVLNNTLKRINNFYQDIISKPNLLVGILKTISKTVSAVVGLNAEEIYKKYIGIGTIYKDANDFTAMLLSAAVKASIALTMAKPMETTAGSTGTGLLLPIGP